MSRYPRTVPKEDITGVFHTEVSSVRKEQESAHKVARALLNDDGHTVLIIDKSYEHAREVGRHILEDGAYDSMVFAESAERAKEILKERPIAAIVIDPSMLESLGEISIDKRILPMNGKNGNGK